MRTNPPIVCYVTDSQSLAGGAEALPGMIRAAARAGVDWIQVREKHLAGRPLSELVRLAMQEARATRHTRVLVNDRLDVALAARADGVHLGGHSLPPADVRAWLERERQRLEIPTNFLFGRSCHSLAEAQQAERDNASYVFFGPVFATPSKTQYGAPQGLDRLREVCGALRIPVLAIGGITPENTGDCLRAGAAGIAAIRLFQESADIAQTLTRLRAPR